MMNGTSSVDADNHHHHRYNTRFQEKYDQDHPGDSAPQSEAMVADQVASSACIWQVKYSPEHGRDYYYNPASESVSWYAPSVSIVEEPPVAVKLEPSLQPQTPTTHNDNAEENDDDSNHKENGGNDDCVDETSEEVDVNEEETNDCDSSPSPSSSRWKLPHSLWVLPLLFWSILVLVRLTPHHHASSSNNNNEPSPVVTPSLAPQQSNPPRPKQSDTKTSTTKNSNSRRFFMSPRWVQDTRNALLERGTDGVMRRGATRYELQQDLEL